MIAPLAGSLRRSADDGFIVVAVLWILGALAALASIYAIYVTNTAISLSVNDDRLQAEALVRAGLELTAYQLSGNDAQARPSQGAFQFPMGRAAVAVEFRSEAARIDLNMAPKELLAGLFAGLGARPDAAAGAVQPRNSRVALRFVSCSSPCSPPRIAEEFPRLAIGARTKDGDGEEDVLRGTRRTRNRSERFQGAQPSKHRKAI